MTHLSRRALIRHASAGAAALSAAGLPALATATPALATDAAQQAGSAAGAARRVLAQVRPRTEAQLALMARLDDTHTTFEDGTVEVLLRDGDLALLDGVDMDYDLMTPAAPAAVARPEGLPTQPGETDGEYRLRSQEYWDELIALAEAHPERAKLLVLGDSLLGDTVHGIMIASDVHSSDDDGRPVVIHDGMHHCREWPSGEMPLMWAYELLESYGTDPDITHIVDNLRTIIVPLVNPDGFNRTTEFAAIAGQSSDDDLDGLVLAIAGQGDMHRKNLRAPSNEGPLEVTGPVVASTPVGASQPDASGIDLNRNYPFFWGDESGSSSNPYDQTYRGTAPFSEPETLNIRDLALRYLPITHITHHTSGQLMLIPWGREPREIRSPDWPIMSGLGVEMRDGWTSGVSGTAYQGNGYVPQQAFNLYPTSGTSRDWGHASTRTIIYTFEHGTEFHGPYPETIPAMYAQNRGAFIRHAFAAIDDTVHATITGTGPAGGTVEITKTITTPTNLQVVGTPVLRVGGLPAVKDPAAGVVRPDEVVETLHRTVTIGDDGTWKVCLPPSTRPYLINESLVGNVPGTLEPYTVIVRDDEGDEDYRGEVIVERGFTAAISEEFPDAIVVGEINTDPLPGEWPPPPPE